MRAVESISMSRVVLAQLGIYSGPQDRILIAHVTENLGCSLQSKQFVVAFIVQHILGHASFRVVDDNTGCMMYVACPTAVDAAKLHGHCWVCFHDRVLFRLVKRINIQHSDPVKIATIEQDY